MVKVYVTDICNLSDPKENPTLMSELSEYRKQKIQRHQTVEKRRQSLGAGLLLQRVLQQYDKDEQFVVVNEHGKPEIEGLYFNISHSGDKVVCVVSDKKVGCDIEKYRQSPANMAEHFYSESEKKYLAQFDGQLYNEAFLRIWTLKESYVKMTGEGMAISRGQFEMLLDEDVKVLRDGNVMSCCFREYKIGEYLMAVCSEDAEYIDELQEVSIC